MLFLVPPRHISHQSTFLEVFPDGIITPIHMLSLYISDHSLVSFCLGLWLFMYLCVLRWIVSPQKENSHFFLFHSSAYFSAMHVEGIQKMSV